MSIENSMRKGLPAGRQGFSPIGLLVLLFAIAGLGASVFVVGQKTGLINFARNLNSTSLVNANSLRVTEFGTIVAPTSEETQNNSACPTSSGRVVCPQALIYPNCQPGVAIVYPSGKDRCGCSLPPTCGSTNNSSAYVLQTTDGRTYPLISSQSCSSKPGSTGGPAGRGSSNVSITSRIISVVQRLSPNNGPTPTLSPNPEPTAVICTGNNFDLSKFVGKTVLVEGTMRRDNPNVWCPPPGMGIPCRITGTTSASSWWPLPSGLDFQVKRVQLASPFYDGARVTGYLNRATGIFVGENVYVLRDLQACTPETFPCPPVGGQSGAGGPNLPRKIYFRSSYSDFGSSVGKKVTVSGRAYIVGDSLGGAIVINDGN